MDYTLSGKPAQSIFHGTDPLGDCEIENGYGSVATETGSAGILFTPSPAPIIAHYIGIGGVFKRSEPATRLKTGQLARHLVRMVGSLTLIGIVGCTASSCAGQVGPRSIAAGAPPETAAALECNITFDAPFGDIPSMPISEGERKAIREACRQWSAVWRTEAFKSRVLDATFTQTAQSDPADVYATITRVNPRPRLLYSLTAQGAGSETAKTDTASGVTRIQSAYFHTPSRTLSDLVNTFSHEYTHTRDGGEYTHNWLSWWPPRSHRELSVPYQIGDITQALAKTMFGDILVSTFGQEKTEHDSSRTAASGLP